MASGLVPRVGPGGLTPPEAGQKAADEAVVEGGDRTGRGGSGGEVGLGKV